MEKSGSKCVNLKETHEIIKLLRLVCNSLKSKPIIITETNLPEKENLSYFGLNNNGPTGYIILLYHHYWFMRFFLKIAHT